MRVAESNPVRSGRLRLASARAAEALHRMRECRLCAWECGTNRFLEAGARCHAGVHARCFLAQTEVADELDLVPCFSIALSGCNMRCAFCISGAESWNAAAGEPLNLKGLGLQAGHAIEAGARSMMILGGEPTVHLPLLLSLAAALPESAPLALKTNGYFSRETRELLDGVFDVLVPDFKFGNDVCALRLAGTANYTSVLHESLLWCRTQPGMIVRHLLMPGHLECCWKPIALWLSTHMPEVRVSLRTAFWPAWKASRHPELLGRTEAGHALEFGRSLGLKLVE